MQDITKKALLLTSLTTQNSKQSWGEKTRKDYRLGTSAETQEGHMNEGQLYKELWETPTVHTQGNKEKGNRRNTK